MDDNKKMEIALFRYGLIFDLFNDNLSKEEKTAHRRKIIDSEHKIPYSTRTRIDERTLRKYCQMYREGGFEGLMPGYRADKDKVKAVTEENLLKAIQYKKQVPERSVRQIIQIMELEGLIKTGEIKQSTLSRLIKKYSEAYESEIVKNNKVFRRYTMERVNQTWQSDVKYSVYIPDPNDPDRMLRTYLIAFIDDKSRYITHAQFYFSESSECLEDCFKKALLKCGVPERCYMDNGKIYTSKRLDAICAQLGSKIIHCAPYSPEGKGKVEKFFWYIDKSFEPEVRVSNVKTIDELNLLLAAWLDKNYHEKIHSEIEKTPKEAFAEGAGYQKFISPEDIYRIFLYKEERKVNKTAVISVCGNQYEVDARLARKTIQVKYHPSDLTKIEVYYQGDKFADAKPFQITFRTYDEYKSGIVASPPQIVEGQISYLDLLKKKQDKDLADKKNRMSFTKLYDKEGRG